MSIAELKSDFPEYAKDLRLNLESVLGENGAPGLSQQQIAVIALASAVASRHAPLTAAIAEWAEKHADDDALRGARAAAAIMGMNNVYYRFLHLVGNDEYATLRAGLRMNVMSSPGGSKVDFELASLAVSAINGCGACLESHEKTLRTHELGAQAIQSAARIAAVVHAAAVALEQAGPATGSASAREAA